MDFAKLLEVFDRNNVTFVSVTQSFNTTTSMGRLTLNILLSFAQFEREVIGERIRDKFAASRKKGMWMGGEHPGADFGAAERSDLRSDWPSDDTGAHPQGRQAISLLCLDRRADANACPVRRIPAAEIESAVVDQLRCLLRAPEIIVGTWRAARQSMDDINEADVRDALYRLDPLWDELFPAEQARIVHLLIERVDINTEGADIRLRTEGLTTLVVDLRAVEPETRRAA
jgi:hypothetical protein